MATPSPLLAFHRAAGAVLLAYGQQSQSADGGVGPESSDVEVAGASLTPLPIDLVATYGQLEVEYAAIRKHCGLLDLPSRGVLEVTGPDRLDFLNRMVTQELRPGKKDLPAYSLARTFWLSRKGRVDADMRVIVLPDRILLELDALAAQRATTSLSSFIVMEECSVSDITVACHRLSLHGPTSAALLGRVTQSAAAAPLLEQVSPAGGATEGTIAGVAVIIVRDDSAGVPGFELVMPTDGALAVARKLIEVGHDTSHGDGIALPVISRGEVASGFRLTPIGWLAYNIARIEAGSPLFNIDFGLESLPAETGVLHSRVSFTKGCYLGQEIVARMHARGQSKQQLVSVKFESVHAATAAGDAVSSEGECPYSVLPAEGSVLAAESASGPQPVGVVTSSTLSPAMAMAPIAFAQVKSTHASPGTVLTTHVDGVVVRGVVQGALAFSSPRAL